MNKPIFTSYDLLNRSQTGEDIYNWCVAQMTEEGHEKTIATLLLKKYWHDNRVFPRKNIFYKLSPIQFDENGQMTIQLFRDITKSPRPEKKQASYSKPTVIEDETSVTVTVEVEATDEEA